MSDSTGPNIQELLQAAQQMQSELSRAQESLAQKTVEGSGGGGMVKAVANGRQQLVSLQIEPEVVDPQDIGMLQDLVVAAVNQALTKAAQLAQEEMGKITGQMNLNIPGMF